MKYKNKLKLKLIWYHILAILTMITIAIIGALQGKFFEIILSMICFFIYRPLFEKQYHSNSLYKCSLISIIVFFIMSRITVGLETSLFFTIILTFLLTCASYFIKDLLDKTVLLEYYKNKVENFKDKAIENYTKEELIEKLPHISTEILEIVYEYLHRENHETGVSFALKKHISVSLLYKYLKTVKNELGNQG